MIRSLTFVCGLCIACIQVEGMKIPLEKYALPSNEFLEKKRNHVGHHPLIGYLTFRNICDRVIDDFMEEFDPCDVKCGDSIFVNIQYLDWFAEQVHDRIQHPYVLVTCDYGGALPTPASKKLLYDPKCAAWFGRNMIFSYHPKLVQLPFGQDMGCISIEHGVERPLLEACTKKSSVTKKHLLYMNHTPRSYGDRDKIVKLFENAPYCMTRNRSDAEYKHVSFEQYYEDLLSSCFVISPLGLETDCIRTWEALALGCIPIMEHAFIDPLFEGLPVVIVHNWEQIDEEFLHKKYEQLKDLKDIEKIFFNYWGAKIKEAQKRIRNQDTGFALLEATLFNAEDLSNLSEILQEYGSDNQKRIHLSYRGNLSALRALQLAFEMPRLASFCLHDVWLEQGTWDHLEYFLMDHNLLMMRSKIALAHSEESFANSLKEHNGKGSAIFLDLAYFRHALYLNPFYLERQRFSLKRDLLNLISDLSPQVLLCGNMVQNLYVKEVLEQISLEHRLKFETRGNFWFLYRIAIQDIPEQLENLGI